jgi:hemoglobin/transferrin/lactoferrin receptor protein
MNLSKITPAFHLRAILAGLAMLFVLSLGGNSFGQSGSKITIIVTDVNGAKVAGATITLSGRQLVPITAVTDNNGTAAFNAVTQDDLKVAVAAPGFPTVIREVSAGAVDIVLSPGGISENVTVTATRTQISTDDTAVPVSVIGREEIERRGVNTVGDIFRTLPGTSTVNEGAFQVRPRIRGLESNRILILVDGERLNNARTSTGQSGIEIGLADIEQIETLEVVRGAGSVLYGTDALAGTVNIITRDTPRRRDDGFRFGGQLSTYFSSNEKGRRGNLGLTGSSKFFAFRVAQSLERYENYFAGDTAGLGLDATDGFVSEGEVGNSQSHGGNTQITTRFFFNDNNDLRLNVERRRAANVGSPLLTLDFGFNAYFPYSDRDKFNGRFETRNLNKYLVKAAASFYYQKQKREFSNQTIFMPFVNSLSETVTDTDSYGLDLQTNWLLGSRNFLTAGVSFFRDENSDTRLSLNRLTGVANRTTSVPKADFGSVAFFAQDEFTVTNRLKLIGGVRVERFSSGSEQTEGFALPPGIRQFQLEDIGVADLATGLNVNETAVTGDFGAVYRLTDAVSLTGRVGRSFRVANLFERFFTGAGSIGGFLVGNPNLVPESGINFDTAVKVRTSKFAGSFTYFNNNYRNFLSSDFAYDNREADPRCPVIIATPSTVYLPAGPGRPSECIPSGGSFTRVQQTINFGKVRLQGFEAELEVPFRIGDYGFLTPNGNISYLRGDNLETDAPFNIAPPLKTVLNLRWNDLANRYYGEFQTRIVNKHERLSGSFLASNGGPEPGFAVSDIRGGYSFRRERFNVNINAGVTNIFNRYYNEQFILAPARGRSFTIGTTWEIK